MTLGENQRGCPFPLPGIAPSSASPRPALSPLCFTTTGWRLRRLRELPEVTQQKDFEFEPQFTGTTWLSVMNRIVYSQICYVEALAPQYLRP